MTMIRDFSNELDVEVIYLYGLINEKDAHKNLYFITPDEYISG